jgi:molybdate transport system regulatory protein
MDDDDQTVGAQLRVIVAPGVRIGPGKAALLQGIKESGSISAAGRSVSMSYKRAWYLVEAMNGHFGEPLVIAVKGGRAGGGARLTPLGEEVLAAFREMEKRAQNAVRPVLRRLQDKVAPREAADEFLRKR